MAKFQVVGVNKEDIMNDHEFKLLRIFSDELSGYPDLEEKEAGNILVYKVLRYAVNENFRNKFGDFGEYNFIKDSVLEIAEKKMKLNILGSLEEDEIPKTAGIMIKF